MATIQTVRAVSGQRQEFILSPQSAAYRRVIDLHHVQEVRARQDARRTVSWLRQVGRRDAGKDRVFLCGLARQYGIAGDHVDLFVEIITQTIDKDLRR